MVKAFRNTAIALCAVVLIVGSSALFEQNRRANMDTRVNQRIRTLNTSSEKEIMLHPGFTGLALEIFAVQDIINSAYRAEYFPDQVHDNDKTQQAKASAQELFDGLQKGTLPEWMSVAGAIIDIHQSVERAGGFRKAGIDPVKLWGVARNKCADDIKKYFKRAKQDARSGADNIDMIIRAREAVECAGGMNHGGYKAVGITPEELTAWAEAGRPNLFCKLGGWVLSALGK